MSKNDHEDDTSSRKRATASSSSGGWGWKDEKEKWGEADHVVRRIGDQDAILAMQDLVHEIPVDDMAVHVSMCCREVTLGLLSEVKQFLFLDYYLVLQWGERIVLAECALENDEIVLSVREVSTILQGENDLVREDRIAMHQSMKDRLLEMCGFNNYSYFLRNSEHIINYIWSGRWGSDQLAMLRYAAVNSPEEALCRVPPQGLQFHTDAIEVNVVFYGKVSSGKSQLLRALLSQALKTKVSADNFRISPIGGSTVTPRSYFYEQMTVLADSEKTTAAKLQQAIQSDAEATQTGETVETSDEKQEDEKQDQKRHDETQDEKEQDGTQQDEEQQDEKEQGETRTEAETKEPKKEQQPELSTQRRKTRVVFWDTPGIGLKMSTKMKTGELSFDEIKKAIDVGVEKVDLCVFVFNGDGNEELYEPYVEMVKQIAKKNNYKKGDPEYARAVKRVILVRTHGDSFDWDPSTALEEQFTKGLEDQKLWPTQLCDLFESICKRINLRLEENDFPGILEPKDLCHVSSRAYIPDYDDDEELFQQMLEVKTYGIQFLLNRIYATATAEANLILLEKHRLLMENAAKGIRNELLFGIGGGSIGGLGVGGGAIGLYSVVEGLVAMYGGSAALGAMGTAAVVGLPVLAGSFLGGLGALAMKHKEIKKYLELSIEEQKLKTAMEQSHMDNISSPTSAKSPTSGEAKQANEQEKGADDSKVSEPPQYE